MYSTEPVVETHFIEHIVEPNTLLLAWQSSDEEHRSRYIVGELYQEDQDIKLVYLRQTKDFEQAKELGFEGYPAFKDITKIHEHVLDAFMRRLPPRTRGDFDQYLEGLRLKPGVKLSDFALLGYSGAKLLSDGFSIIHPFRQAAGPCELLIEVAGYRHLQPDHQTKLELGMSAQFIKEEVNVQTKENAVRIEVNSIPIGYVNRGLVPTFLDWIEQHRIEGAWVEKKNGVPGKPSVYLFVKVSSKQG